MKRRTILPIYLLVLLLIAAAIVLKSKAQKTTGEEPAKPAVQAKFEIVGNRVKFLPIHKDLAGRFTGAKAFEHVAALSKLGPRPPASAGYQSALAYLEKEFKAAGWITARQKFTARTPTGEIAFTNLLARFRDPVTPWASSTPVLIGGHLDSKRMANFSFVGANDGGSSTGVILELAQVLATDPESAAKVEFVLFDGEEALGESITPTDGLYGSKHFARGLMTRETRPSLGIVLDLVGDDDHDFYYNPETPRSFATAVENAARESGLNKLRRSQGAIIDDHIPLQEAGLPCLHLIGDFMNMPYWHKPGDTMDVIDADALKKTGRTTLRFLSSLAP
ncbi:M28 family peptidase [Luteolibacter arcticus]|uniref:M28 family peptidase n=1 Tax=Luteolibacter arcticus TaxID=1581411 RepID=A0ABT3GKS8_9BACT|nr:M28 family peptidase [Luteolibacter arcticus]MCW1924117.1 M28 family peptidase [Luteolibacter arcticus]